MICNWYVDSSGIVWDDPMLQKTKPISMWLTKWHLKPLRLTLSWVGILRLCDHREVGRGFWMILELGCFFFWRSHWERIVNPIIPYHRWISRLKRTLLSSFRTFIHVGVVRPSWPWAWGWRFRRGSHPIHWGDRAPIYFLCKLHRLPNIQCA